jgi:hypothetical protein
MNGTEWRLSERPRPALFGYWAKWCDPARLDRQESLLMEWGDGSGSTPSVI